MAEIENTQTPIAVVSCDKEILELAGELQQFTVVGFFDQNPSARFAHFERLGSDEDFEEANAKWPGLRIAMAIDPPALKTRLIKMYGADALETLISKHSIISKSATLEKGCIVQAGSRIMPDATIGRACKININATIHHDCEVGDHCTIAPSATLLGNVVVGRESYIGAGAIILPRISIGDSVVVGAGAVVTRNVLNGATVAGVPAEPLDQSR